MKVTLQSISPGTAGQLDPFAVEDGRQEGVRSRAVRRDRYGDCCRNDAGCHRIGGGLSIVELTVNVCLDVVSLARSRKVAARRCYSGLHVKRIRSVSDVHGARVGWTRTFSIGGRYAQSCYDTQADKETQEKRT